jgi:hypothetical protein
MKKLILILSSIFGFSATLAQRSIYDGGEISFMEKCTIISLKDSVKDNRNRLLDSFPAEHMYPADIDHKALIFSKKKDMVHVLKRINNYTRQKYEYMPLMEGTSFNDFDPSKPLSYYRGDRRIIKDGKYYYFLEQTDSFKVVKEGDNFYYEYCLLPFRGRAQKVFMGSLVKGKVVTFKKGELVPLGFFYDSGSLNDCEGCVNTIEYKKDTLIRVHKKAVMCRLYCFNATRAGPEYSSRAIICLEKGTLLPVYYKVNNHDIINDAFEAQYVDSIE